jgi:hypothetical protein
MSCHSKSLAVTTFVLYINAFIVLNEPSEVFVNRYTSSDYNEPPPWSRLFLVSFCPSLLYPVPERDFAQAWTVEGEERSQKNAHNIQFILYWDL